jgi:Rnl2 family RNA ligase
MFVPYDKIEERWEGDPATERILARETWVVTEKIHGANFVVAAEPGRRLRFAKRKELLAPGESFFAHEPLVARLEERFESVVAAARDELGPGTILIYGELFGGRYPHPSVPPIAGQKPVQTGVWYCPQLEYCAFDLAAVSADGAREFLAYDRALALFAGAGLFAAEPLLVGSLNDATRFPVERTTTIPARLGLPPLDEPNPAEGIVIKTVNPVRLPGGELVRPILKRKIARFSEDERYSGGEKPTRSPRESSEALTILLERAVSLVNPPRVAAAISKIGPLDDDEHREDPRREQALSLVRDEILEELARNEPRAMALLTPPDRALLAAQIALLAEPLLIS